MLDYNFCVLLQKLSGDKAVKSLKDSGDLKLETLLQGDPEFDSALESPQAFLKKQGLQCLL